MTPESLVEELRASKEYFDRSSRCLQEEHSKFAPAEGMYTVAQQVAHAAQAVEWCVEGAFRPEGFDMDMEKAHAEVTRVTSLAEARAWMDRAYAKSMERIGSSTMEELQQLLPPGPVMGAVPRAAVVAATCEHTAHHRGALAVYSRLCGLKPPMPYMETEAG